jgi:uncharacterized protein
MRLGLTGATGFIGRHVIQAALRRGFEVVAFSRDASRPVPDCVETRMLSLESPPDLKDCEAIIHLAGENLVGLWTQAKRQRIRDSRIAGTRRVVEAIRGMATPPEVLVSASAVGAYPDLGEQEIMEQTQLAGGFLGDLCRDWEAEASKAPIRVVLPRIGIVLGRGGGALAAMRPAFRLCLGAKLGSGRQWMAWIHVEDLASLLLFAVENLDIHGPINAVAPWPVRNADFTRSLARTLRRPSFLRAPAFMLRLLLGDFADGMLASQRVVPAAATAAGFPFRFPEIEPALRDLV